MPVFKKDIPNDPKTLLKRIKGSFPDIGWGSYVYIDEGWDHEVIILDNKLVFRFPNDAQYSLKNETEVLKNLKSLVPLAIPDYSFIAPDFSFVGYKLIAGQVLSKEFFDSLSVDSRTEIAKQLAGFLSALHKIPLDSPYLSLVEKASMRQFQNEVRQQTTEYLKPVLGSQDLSLVMEIIEKIDLLLAKPLPSVFLHGDVYSRHLLWDTDTNKLGIIDFSDMYIGDPAYDFAELHEYGQQFVYEVYKYYSGPKDETFLDRAWAYQRWVGVFMMTDHFVYGKTPFEEARQTFDRTKNGH